MRESCRLTTPLGSPGRSGTVKSGKPSCGPGLLQRLVRPAPHCTTQIRLAMPLMLDATHQQSTIESDRTLGEERLILEEAGPYFLHFQRLHLPVQAAQLQTLETRSVGSRRVSQGARLEERGGFPQRAKHR